MTFAANYHQWIVGQLAPFLGKRVAEVGAGIGSVPRLPLERLLERLTPAGTKAISPRRPDDTEAILGQVRDPATSGTNEHNALARAPCTPVSVVKSSSA